MPTFTLHDLLGGYWHQQVKPVFLYRTLIEGLLEYVNKFNWRGFDRGILEYNLSLSGN